MTIEQFCEQLKEARVLSGISWLEVCHKMQKSQSAVITMLSGKSDTSMERIFNYIEAIEAEIVVKKHVFCHEPELHSWLNQAISGYKNEQVCEIIHTTPRTVTRLRGNKCHYKISYFLSILDCLKLPCQVIPIDIKIGY